MDEVHVQGVAIPAIGLGTYPMTGEQCREAVRRALDLGYRHVDTAQAYGNEAAVGAGISASSVPRDEVFVVTKIDRSNLASDDVIPSVRESLHRLQTDIDLLLIHGPSSEVPTAETIRAMNELQADGDVAHIGVSNFSVQQLAVASEVSETPILTNQVAYHAYEDRADMLSYCRTNDVALTAFSPLANGRLLANDRLAAIGTRYDKSPAQVALRWLIQQENVAAIPKAAARPHQVENLAVFDFELTDAEMREIADLRAGLTNRIRSVLGW